MPKFIEDFLNRTTMYRLVMYYLFGLFAVAEVFAYFGVFNFTPFSLTISVAYITAISMVANFIFAKIFKAHTNIESVYITALILSFIITPIQSLHDTLFLSIGFWASIFAVASKYILAIRKKHIFNPAAIAVVLTAFIFSASASWWIGTSYMFVPVLIGGLLLTKKLIRFDLVISFLVAASLSIIFSRLSLPVLSSLKQIFIYSPILFFAFIMLTEPLTTPPTRGLRIAYGALVGLLFSPSIHLGSFYLTPELALIIGNLFSYIVSPKERMMMTLKAKLRSAQGVYDFLFVPDRQFAFVPGQYLEWTLSHKSPDNRGNRRYFTIASSPTEDHVRLGVRFYDNPSTYKSSLSNMKEGSTIVASARAGDFTLPKDASKKLVFMAGGIGITPFRSITKYMIDSGDKRDAILIYSNKALSDVAYTDIFDEAYEKMGMKTIYTLTEVSDAPPEWQGEKGMVNKDMILRNVPDYRNRIFYLSGPHSMVTAFEKILKGMGVPRSQIKKDFFPGLV